MVIMSKNNKQLKNLATSAAKILNGEYFEKINSDDYTSSLKPIAECIIHLREQMLNQMFEMQVSSNQVDSVSHQIGSVIQTQFENTTKLYEDADEMSQLNEKNKELFQETIHKFNNMDEITVHMKNSINKLEASGHKAQENIKNRLIEIKKIVDCIDKISTSTKTFANYLRELSSSIEEISKVLEIIRNFSKQTHLLSLNASIEAARAGESGRGFSIVAQEVRQMAEDSNNTVDQISGLIKDLNREIDNVLKYTGKNEDNVTSAVEESLNVERGLKDIEDAFIAIHGDIKNIIETSNTYTDEISYINKVIENTYLSSQQVAAGIDIVYSSVEKQRNLADKMQNLDNSLKEYSTGLSNVIDKINMNLLDGNNEWMTTQAQKIGHVLENTILENKILENLNYNNHKIILDKVMKDNEQIEAIWTNKLDGDFIYSNPPAGIVNSSIREWFQESKAGKTFISDVYISAISKKPCITVSMPAYDEENNLLYLIGADIKIVLSC